MIFTVDKKGERAIIILYPAKKIGGI